MEAINGEKQTNRQIKNKTKGISAIFKKIKINLLKMKMSMPNVKKKKRLQNSVLPFFETLGEYSPK